MKDDDDDDDDDAPLSQMIKLKKAKKKSKSRDGDDDGKKPNKKKEKSSDGKKESQKRKATSSDSSPAPPPKKKKTKIKAEENATTPTKTKTQSSSNTNNNKQLKKLDKTERLQYAMQSFLWWNAPEPPEGCQWTSLEHAGVAFPEPYTPHGIPLYYNSHPVKLTPMQEEAATLFAAMDPEGMHLGNPKTAKIFIQNFFTDFKKLLGRGHVVQDFKKCDFEPIRQHLNEQKIIRKAITDQERKANKEDRNAVLFQFGFALVDGHLERVGNYNMEPPGAFRGRGEHPKMGRLKDRVRPEQVSLNCSQGAAVPRCSVPGHAWGDIKHDPRGQWLATWKENINNQVRSFLCVCDCLLWRLVGVKWNGYGYAMTHTVVFTPISQVQIHAARGAVLLQGQIRSLQVQQSGTAVQVYYRHSQIVQEGSQIQRFGNQTTRDGGLGH